MTDTLDENTTGPDTTIDPETGNKIITWDRNGETMEFIVGSSPLAISAAAATRSVRIPFMFASP